MDNNNLNQVEVNLTDTPKKGKVLLPVLITILTVLILSLGAFCYFFFIDGSLATMFLNPKEKVMYAVAKASGPGTFVTIMSGNEDKVKVAENTYNNKVSTFLNLIEIRKQMKESGSDVTINAGINKLKIPGVRELRQLSGAGFNTNYKFDPNNRMARYDLSVDYLSNTVIDGSILVDDANLCVAEYDFFDGYIMVNTETLSDDYYDSDIYAETNNDELPEISFNIIDFLEGFNDISYDYEAVYSKDGENYKLFKDLYDSIEVTETGETEIIEVAGKDTKCKEYEVLIPGDAISDYLNGFQELSIDLYIDYLNQYIDFIEENVDVDALDIDTDDLRDIIDEISDETDLEEYSEELAEIFDKDYKINVYLDKKCRLISVKYNDTFSYENDDEDIDLDVNFEITWRGDKHLYDKFDGTLSFETDDNIAEITFDSNAEYDGDTRIQETSYELEADDEFIATVTVTKNNSTDGSFLTDVLFETEEDEISIDMTIEGTYTESKDNITLDLEDISFEFENADEDIKFGLSFNALISFGVLQDEIEYLEGPEYELFDMSIHELEDLIEEIGQGIEDSPIGAYF